MKKIFSLISYSCYSAFIEAKTSFFVTLAKLLGYKEINIKLGVVPEKQGSNLYRVYVICGNKLIKDKNGKVFYVEMEALDNNTKFLQTYTELRKILYNQIPFFFYRKLGKEFIQHFKADTPTQKIVKFFETFPTKEDFEKAKKIMEIDPSKINEIK